MEKEKRNTQIESIIEAKKIKNIIFDLDGTLFDTSNFFWGTMFDLGGIVAKFSTPEQDIQDTTYAILDLCF